MPRMPMDKFSRLIAAHAFARFPEWRHYVRRVPSSDGTVALLLELPTPAEAQVEYGLSLSTEDHEITISFDAWHEHLRRGCTNSDPRSPEDRARAAWQSADQVLDDLCAERTVVASWWFESHWRGSQCAPAGSPLEEPDHSYSNRRRVRSWKGTFNEDVRTDAFDTIARLPCPSCGETDGARCGQAVRGTRRFWFRVTRCPACGAATKRMAVTTRRRTCANASWLPRGPGLLCSTSRWMTSPGSCAWCGGCSSSGKRMPWPSFAEQRTTRSAARALRVRGPWHSLRA